MRCLNILTYCTLQTLSPLRVGLELTPPAGECRAVTSRAPMLVACFSFMYSSLVLVIPNSTNLSWHGPKIFRGFKFTGIGLPAKKLAIYFKSSICRPI